MNKNETNFDSLCPFLFFRLFQIILLSTAFTGFSSLVFASQSPQVFDAEAVKEFTWEDDSQKLTATKIDKKEVKSETWIFKQAPKDWKPDSWNIHRRLALLAEIQDLPAAESAKPPNFSGHVSIILGKYKLQGDFNSDILVWKTGPAVGKVINFNAHPEVKALFDEGIRGLTIHDLKICDPRKVDSFESLPGHWSLKKGNKIEKWTLSQGESKNPARFIVTLAFIERVCTFSVDAFVKPESADLTKVVPAATLMVGKKEIHISSFGRLFTVSGQPSFQSQILEGELKINPDDLKDSSLEEGKIALDQTKSQQERIQAIRKIKDSRSVEGISALKALVNEKTEIDLYRYEAVDALAAIGSKDAYKIIADRLSDIGRSGFELRLARALSMAMGRTFMSDEKTPEPQRRQEVQDLLEAYRKTPPGH